MKTATMVEHVNEYGQWVWYSVTNQKPKEAIKEYLKDISAEEEKVEEIDGEVIVQDMVRAYTIPIE